jgi:polar amino acid transport system substrate-binding protein
MHRERTFSRRHVKHVHRRGVRARPIRHRGTVLLLAPAVVLGLALTACGSSNSPGASTTDKSYSITGVGAVPKDASLASQLNSQFKPLTFVFDPPYPPFEQFYNGTNVEGSNVDFVNAIAATLGTTAQINVTTSFTSEIPGVESGKYDVIGDTIGDEGAPRIKVVNYIDYVRSPGFILGVTTANPDHITSWGDLCGKGLAGESGDIISALIPTLNKDLCTSQGKPPIQFHQYPTQPDARLAVISGREAAVTLNAFAFLGKSSESQQFKEIIDPQEVAIANKAGVGGPAYFGIVVAKNQPALSKLVLEAVQKLAAEGIYKKIFDKWGLGSFLVNPPLYNHPLTSVQAHEGLP